MQQSLFIGAIVSFLSVFSMASSAQAFPAKGDYAKYQAMYMGSPVTIEKTLIDEDQASNIFVLHNKVTYKGEVVQDDTMKIEGTWFYTPAKIQYLFKTCISREGVLGHETVLNKKIQVCEFYNEDSQLSTSTGMVPFGQVRFQVYLEGEDFLDFYLVDYKDASK